MITYEEIINSMPAGLDRAILRVLSFRQGAESAIKKKALIRELANLGFSSVGERQVRVSINNLRKGGHLIGSSAGKDPGYYMIAGWHELDEFLSQEIDARIKDLCESKSALIRAASSEFGAKPLAFQERLL